MSRSRLIRVIRGGRRTWGAARRRTGFGVGGWGRAGAHLPTTAAGGTAQSGKGRSATARPPARNGDASYLGSLSRMTACRRPPPHPPEPPPPTGTRREVSRKRARTPRSLQTIARQRDRSPAGPLGRYPVGPLGPTLFEVKLAQRSGTAGPCRSAPCRARLSPALRSGRSGRRDRGPGAPEMQPGQRARGSTWAL